MAFSIVSDLRAVATMATRSGFRPLPFPGAVCIAPYAKKGGADQNRGRPTRRTAGDG
jgi:hypothetical protein